MVSDIQSNVDLWLVAVLAAILIVGLIYGAVKGIPLLRKIAAFMEDVAGSEARPGRDRVPGLFERLGSIETKQFEVSSKVSQVHHQMFPNGGDSLKDQNNRIEEKLTADYQEIESIKTELGIVKADLSTLSSTLDTHIQVSAGILRTLNKEKP